MPGEAVVVALVAAAVVMVMAVVGAGFPAPIPSSVCGASPRGITRLKF